MGIRGEIFTLGTLLYVDSLYVGFRSLEPQERGEKKIGGWGNWGYVGIRGDTGGSLTPSTLLSIETLY